MMLTSHASGLQASDVLSLAGNAGSSPAVSNSSAVVTAKPVGAVPPVSPKKSPKSEQSLKSPKSDAARFECPRDGYCVFLFILCLHVSAQPFNPDNIKVLTTVEGMGTPDLFAALATPPGGMDRYDDAVENHTLFFT